MNPLLPRDAVNVLLNFILSIKVISTKLPLANANGNSSPPHNNTKESVVDPRFGFRVDSDDVSVRAFP